jgi:hypothetical protein
MTSGCFCFGGQRRRGVAPEALVDMVFQIGLVEVDIPLRSGHGVQMRTGISSCVGLLQFIWQLGKQLSFSVFSGEDVTGCLGGVLFGFHLLQVEASRHDGFDASETRHLDL